MAQYPWSQDGPAPPERGGLRGAGGLSRVTPVGYRGTSGREDAAMENTTVNVEGMTCGHCAGTVTRAVGAVEGVTGVEVDLDAGQVRLTGEADLAAVRSAIVDAGYTPTG
jgi:copper chaperone